MLPRCLLPWLVALTLLFGQATAFAHAIGHLHKHDAGAPEPVCEVCVAHANLGSTLPVSACLPPLAPALHAAPAVEATYALPSRPARALARAPPAPV
ncbi:MAG: hypothetical protein K0M48_02185 [Thiobacillus sp.]|nr:hypothetical protein [Thiobacillus sp.]